MLAEYRVVIALSGDGPQDAAALAKMFQDALVNFVRPSAKEEEVCVDFASKMSKLGLDVWFPDEVLHAYVVSIR